MTESTDRELPVLARVVPDGATRARVNLMLKLLGADPTFTALRNLAPVLEELMATADRAGLYLGFADTAHRDAIQALTRALASVSPSVAARWVPVRGGNPVGGRFAQYPILGALLEPLTKHGDLIRHARVLLVGIALSAQQPGAFPRLTQYATQLRLATDFKDTRQHLLRHLYAAPQQGLGAVGRLLRRADALLQRRRTTLTDSEKEFAASLFHLATLYTEQWVRLEPASAGLPDVRFLPLGEDEGMDDGLGGRLQAGFLEFSGGDQASESEDDEIGDHEAPDPVVREEPPSPDRHPASPAGFEAAVRRAAGLRRYRARPVPWASGFLNPFERARLVAHLEQVASEPWTPPAAGAALLSALVLALGRDPFDLMALAVGPGSGFDEPGVLRHPAPSTHAPPRHPGQGALAEDGSEVCLKLTLPPVVNRLLSGLRAGDTPEPLAERLGIPRDKCAQAIVDVCSPALLSGRRRATPARLRDTLRAALLRESHDPVCVYAITGSPRDQPLTGALYASFPIEALEAIHRRTILAVFSKDPFPAREVR